MHKETTKQDEPAVGERALLITYTGGKYTRSIPWGLIG